MSTEQRLRDAMAAEAARVEPIDRWAQIEAAIDAGPRRSPARYLPLAAAALAMLAAAIAVVTQRDTGRQPVNADETPTTVTPTTAPAAVYPVFSWPFEGGATYASAHDVADAFARYFLGMPDPTVSAYRAGDAHSGEIDIHPYSTGTIGSTLVVRESDAGWHVLSALSANLQLDQPAEAALIASPVHLSGRSVAFEGTVHVTLLAYGGSLPCALGCAGPPGSNPSLASTTFTGHGTELAPFETDVTFDKGDALTGVLILWADSARDGSTAEATIRLVRFG